MSRVLGENEPLDETISKETTTGAPLSSNMRAWLQEATSGTLRWKGRLDHILDTISLRKKPSGWLRKTLLISAYQLVAQDRTAAGAVVSETVSLVKRKEGDAPGRFANACLRKISAHSLEWRNLKFPEGPRGETFKAAWASMPVWFWKKLCDQRGENWAKEFARASLERPKLWIRVRPEKSDVTEFTGEAGPIPGSFIIATGEKELSGANFFVQDISSQLLVHEVGKIVQNEKANPTALDLCAAPGGKSVGLSWGSFAVTSTDRNKTRLALLKSNIERLSPKIQMVSFDELDSVSPKDLVWVDAPCSGSGIIRRHPDIRWLRKEVELQSLVETQKELFLKGWNKVLPNGFLAYSVCSVFLEEGRNLLPFFKENGASVIQEWDLSPAVAPYGDGFWAVLLQKSG